MSDDLVNQITLNFLISKQQLHKLNKKIRQKEDDKMKTDMEIYKEQINELFTKMINNELPDDLLEDVKHSYNYFVEKSIYYLKMRVPLPLEEDANSSNAEEEEEEEDEDEDEEDEDASLEEDANSSNAEEEDKEESNVKQSCPKVYAKTKQTKSKGVDDIQQLPLDWFSKVRQTYKQNQIIPRQKGKEEKKK